MINIMQDTSEIKYEGKIDLSVKNNSHTLAYDLISEDTKGKKSRILEVGCSSGYFGQALKNAGHEVWGIELNSIAAERAKNVLDKVFVGTIEAFLEDHVIYQKVKFDYIIFGDVLEHLPSPTEVLQQCQNILTPSGAIIASIPNVAHIAVRLMLLEGRWDYSNLGIMDRTHLKFFTKKTILEMFNSAAYSVKQLESVRLPAYATGININPKLMKNVEAFVTDDAKDVFQYVLLAKRSSNVLSAENETDIYLNKSIKLLCLLPDINSSLAKIRILDPLKVWAANHNGLIRIKHIGDYQDNSDAEWADVVIFQREANAYTLQLIDYFRTVNKKIIFDLDDLLTDVPVFLTAHKHHHKTKKFLKRLLKLSDIVTVTNQRLSNEISAYNHNINIIPNCSKNLPYLPNKHVQGEVSLLIASSDSIQINFIIPVLSELLKQSKIKFNLIGIGEPAKFLANQGLPINIH